MAKDTVRVHLSHTSKRDAEVLMGRELKPVNPQGGNDLYELPQDVAERIGDIPAHPPKAEDSVAIKHFHRDLHNQSKDEDAEDVGEAEDEPNDDIEPSEDADADEDAKTVPGPGATHA